MVKNLLGLQFIVSVFLWSCSKKEETQVAIPTLKAVEVLVQKVPIAKEFIGQVYGRSDIPIRARVDGFVEKIHYKEGFEVDKGQLLYTIDDSPFQINVSREESILSEAKINKVNAENELSRIAPLAEINAISKRDLDAATARRDAAEEAVEAAKANKDLAMINLGYTKIYSPISGIIGKSKAKIGEYVGKAPNPVILNTVSEIDSVIVEFFLNEKDYITFAKEMLSGTTETRKIDSPLELFLADEEKFPYTGKIIFLDRNVDPTTGAILVQSIFPNPDRLIRPGQFAKVKSIVNVLDSALTIPQRCVFEIQGFYNVFVVDSEGVVKQKQIEILDSYEDLFVVKSGLTQGEKVLIEGLMTVKSDQKVNAEVVSFESQN